MARQRFEAHVMPPTGKPLKIGTMDKVIDQVVTLLQKHPAYGVRVRRRQASNDPMPTRFSLVVRHDEPRWTAERHIDEQFMVSEATGIAARQAVARDFKELRNAFSNHKIEPMWVSDDE